LPKRDDDDNDDVDSEATYFRELYLFFERLESDEKVDEERVSALAKTIAKRPIMNRSQVIQGNHGKIKELLVASCKVCLVCFGVVL